MLSNKVLGKVYPGSHPRMSFKKALQFSAGAGEFDAVLTSCCRKRVKIVSDSELRRLVVRARKLTGFVDEQGRGWSNFRVAKFIVSELLRDRPGLDKEVAVRSITGRLANSKKFFK
jgi:hypothetical protein